MTNYDIFQQFLQIKADTLGIPLAGSFELTARCNLDCKMCYIHRRANDAQALRRERPASWWLELARQCQQAGLLHLLLTGGEPFLHPQFRDIYLGCQNLGMMLSINTNGTVLNDELLDFLGRNPPLRMNITLYGASPETYEALCGDGSAYDRAVRNILALQKLGILVKLNCSVTPYNLRDFPAILDFSKVHNLPIQAATYMFPPIRACEFGACQTRRLSPEDSARAQIDYELFRHGSEECQKRWQRILDGVRVPDPDRECLEIPTETIRCRAGSSTFWVTWNGELRPCGMMSRPGFSLDEMPFPQAWEQLRKTRKTILVPAQCTACDMAHACDQCAALCLAETGRFDQAPDYMCRRTEAYLQLIRQKIDPST